MKNEKATISLIAEDLGISAISVSRALSGQPGVSDTLRNKILLKAAEMGYSKNKNNINILVLHQKPYIQDNSNFSYMVQGIESALQKAEVQYSVEFIDKDKQDKLYLPIKLSRDYFFDGVIFIGRFDYAYSDFLRSKIKNQVFYTGYSPSYDYDSVWFNFNNGGYKQCEYLIKNGHKKIGFIGNSTVFKNKEKLLGITTALEQHGIPVNTNWFFEPGENLEETVNMIVNSKENPTAIICHWDFTALKLIKMLYQRGIRVPDDISVVSSGNTDMSSLSIPGLTTLDLNIDYSCEEAVSLLLKRISNPNKPYESITINSTLIERDSVKNLLQEDS